MPPCARSSWASASASMATSPAPMARPIFSSCPRTIPWVHFSPPLIAPSWDARLTMFLAKKGGGGFGDSKMKSYVFSHSQPPGERAGVIFVNESPKSFLEKLRKRPGKNIWLMGGGELARDFLKDDLVDELYIGIVPVLIGEGIPLFPSGFLQREFTLLANKTFSKGLIALKYARVRKKPKRK